MQNLSEKKFGNLTVIKLVRINKKPFWECICVCGNIVLTTTTALNAGHKKSCGCLLKETRKINAQKMGKKNSKNLKNRFFKYVEKTDSCWNWIGDIGVGGYGRFWYKGKTVKAHRLSYLKHKGSIPKGILVCHTCDNSKCVNPEHLFLGTTQVNLKDRDNKNRQAKGEKIGMTKLKTSQIKEIFKLNEYLSITKISKIYKVNYSTISRILKKQTWKHVNI